MPSGRQIMRFAPNGLVLDVDPVVAGDDAWTLARDVVMREHTERVRGLQLLADDPIFPPEHLVFSRNAADAPVWLYQAVDGCALFNGTGHVDLTPGNWLTPTIENPWTGGVLNSIPVVGSRRFWYWDGVGVLTDLPDWPVDRFAQAMRPYKYHLIAMGISEAGTYLEDMVYWSSAAPPGQIPQEWTPAPTNEAGSSELSQTGGEVVDGAALRSSFIIYKDTSTYIMDYTGGSSVMTVRVLFPAQGLLTRNCVAELGNAHFVLTDGDVLRHDGQVQQSAIDGVNRRHLFNSISGGNFRRSFVVSNEKNNEVLVCIPEEGAEYPSLAYVYNRSRDKWGVRDLPEQPAHIAVGQVRLVDESNSWDADPEAWDDDPSPWNQGAGRVDFYDLLEAVPLTGVGELQFLDGAVTRNGEPVTAMVAKEMMALGDATRVKLLKRVWLNVQGTPGTELRVRVSGCMDPECAAPYGAYLPFVVGGQQKIDAYASGRYLSIEISSDSEASVEPWRIVGFGVEVESRGPF